MKRLVIPSFVVLVVCATSVFAADLTKIERTIRKEPVYHGKPKYCLLVFGPEAKTRVWLVQDRDMLYVDRNGDGDLTEPGKKVVAEKTEDSNDGEYAFKAGEVYEGGHIHKDLEVFVLKLDYMATQEEMVKRLLLKAPQARGYKIDIQMELPGYHGNGIDGRVKEESYLFDTEGVLQFSDRREAAPVIHFGGPWQVSLFGPQRLRVGRSTDVVLGVGTPGLGAGTMAWVDYEGVVPRGGYPALDIIYPPKVPGEPRIREHYELKQRC